MLKQARQFPISLLRKAFTMVELLVVITIIVLMLAVAVPVVRVVQGNRSIEAGYNAIAAALGHARQLALYYRSPVGVLFYRDPVTGGQDMRYVMRCNVLAQLFPTYGLPPMNNNASLGDQYLDIIPGETMVTMPSGLAVQVLMGNGAPLSGLIQERYMRLGIVLFDEDGQLASAQYAIPVAGPFFGAPVSSLIYTQVLPPPPAVPGITLAPNGLFGYGTNYLYSHQAICLYDDETYLNQVVPSTGDQFSDDNNNVVTYSPEYAPQYPSTVKAASIPALQADKFAEQNWLDQNGEVLVIKPNDGSLLRNK